jgi:hypothetical protein
MNTRMSSVLLPIVFLASWLVVPAHGGDAVLKPEELLSQHLDAIGTAGVRAATKTRAVQGSAMYRVVVGGGGHEEGKTGLVSDGRKIRFLVRFPQNDYGGENFLFNGDVTQVGFANSNQSRSPLASFVMSQDVVVRDGLIGGVLSTGWPLLNLTDRGAKLSYQGLKKVDGRMLHQVRYEPHKHSELEISLYFEPDTLRHVKTVYNLVVGNNVGATILESARMQPERSSLEERFSDFTTADGLTLPTHWNLQFTRELSSGSTTISEWDLKEDKIQNNLGLDSRNFAVR